MHIVSRRVPFGTRLRLQSNRSCVNNIYCGKRKAWDAPTGASPIMKFYYVYILKSINHEFIYVGFTENLRFRLKQHNNKEELSTKRYAPFKLIHYEAYRNEKDAKRRELYFKTTKGKTTLRYMLKEYLHNI